jgi:MFS family permease
MNMILVVLLSMSIHACYIGSKVTVSLFALELGASQAMVGVLASFYAVIPMLMGVYSGRLADTRGMRLPLMIGAVGTAIAMLCGFLWRDIGGLFAVTLFMGGGFVFFNVSIQTLVGAIGLPQDRARNFAWLSIGYSMSSFIGPVFAGFSIDHAGHPLTFLFFSFFTLIPMFLLVFKPEITNVARTGTSAHKGSSMDLLRDGPLRRLIIISGLSVASSELFAFYVPVFTHQIGLSATTTGLILGSYAAAVLMTRFMLGALTRRFRSDQIMFSFLLLAAGAFAIFPLWHSVFGLVATAFVIGIGVGCTQPLLMSTSYERSPPGRAGEMTGLRLTANNIARIVMPLLSGALGAALGASPVFWLNALNLATVSFLSRR